jgi:hypothetical protein
MQRPINQIQRIFVTAAALNIGVPNRAQHRMR